MPLDAQGEGVARDFDRFDDAVLGAADDMQGVRHLRHRFAMEAADQLTIDARISSHRLVVGVQLGPAVVEIGL